MAAPHRRGRLLLGAGAVVVGVPALAWGGLHLVLRDSVLRPRLIAAVEQVTGRQMTLGGPVGIKLSLVPTITLEQLALANPAGASRAEMLTIRRAEVQLALLPLLSGHLAFRHVTLLQPDLLLEQDSTGNGNWRFTRAKPEAPAQPQPAQPAQHDGSLSLSIAAIDVEDGRLGWRNASSQQIETLGISHLAMRAAAPDAPLGLEGRINLRGVELAARGSAGPLPRLLEAKAAESWPFQLSLAGTGIQAALQGSLTPADAAAVWQAGLELSADQTERLAPFLPTASLPPLSGLHLAAELTSAPNQAQPMVRHLRIDLAGGDLGRWLPGLTLGKAVLESTAEGAPLTAAAALNLRGLPLQAEGSLPPFAALLDGANGPLRLTLSGAEMRAQFEGQLAARGTGGVDGTLSAQVGDTASLLAAFSLPAPRLTQAQLNANLAAPGDHITLTALHLQAREAVLEGEASLQSGTPRPVLSGRINAQRLDVDAMLSPPPATPPGASPTQAPTGATPAVPPRPPLPAPSAGAGRVIPPLPLPLSPLRALDADFQLQVAELRAGGVGYRDLTTHALLKAGKLDLDPLGVSLPGGRISGRLSAEAAEPPRLSLVLRQEGAGLDLRSLLQAYGLPPQASGSVEIDTTLQGAGGDLRVLAGSLNGYFGLALANGQVDNRLLERLGGSLRQMLVPNAPLEGSTSLRCVALRLNLKDGVAHPQALLIETGLADVVGSGEINLGQESLSLRLLPQVRLGGVGLTAPVLVGGSFAAPTYRLDSAGAADAAAGIVGDLINRQTESQSGVLGQLARQLAGRGAGRLPDCAQQLAVARSGRQGPVPPERQQPRGNAQPSNPLDLLRGLLGR
ncbi:MAG TPA: AsmA family protein [Roseomonas sp.]|nr:AsmA family protein [Roseomonas sp.]